VQRDHVTRPRNERAAHVRAGRPAVMMDDIRTQLPEHPTDAAKIPEASAKCRCATAVERRWNPHEVIADPVDLPFVGSIVMIARHHMDVMSAARELPGRIANPSFNRAALDRRDRQQLRRNMADPHTRLTTSRLTAAVL
jgi:hypothetical protein